MKNFFSFNSNLELEKKNNFLNKYQNTINNQRNNYFSLAKFSSISYYLVVPLIGGCLLGFLIDNFLKIEKVFFKIFLLIGLISTFYNLRKIYFDLKNGSRKIN